MSWTDSAFLPQVREGVSVKHIKGWASRRHLPSPDNL